MVNLWIYGVVFKTTGKRACTPLCVSRPVTYETRVFFSTDNLYLILKLLTIHIFNNWFV